MKQIAFIIAFKGFRDEELLIPYEILKDRFTLKIFSSEMGIAIGKLGAQVKVDAVIDNLSVSEYEAVVFIGGPGGYAFLGNPIIEKIIQETITQNKLLAAICMAPLLLAKVGVLTKKKATVFVGDKEELLKHGVIYTGKSVEQDGNIITADGPASAKEFAEKIQKNLS